MNHTLALFLPLLGLSLLTPLQLLPAHAQSSIPEDELEELYNLCSKFPYNARCEGLDIPIPLDERQGAQTYCWLDLGSQAKFNTCKVIMGSDRFTVYVEEGEPIALLGDRRASVEVSIPLDNIWAWHAMWVDDSESEWRSQQALALFFVTDSLADGEDPSGNRSNTLRLPLTTQLSVEMLEQVQKDERLPRLDAIAPHVADWSNPEVDDPPPASELTAQVQLLLETNRCVRCDLRGADLQGLDLDGANLEGADLRGANLTETELENAYLVGANLSEAVLSEADLDRANLLAAVLEGSILDGASLKSTFIQGSNFQSASLIDVNFSGFTSGQLAQFQNANLQNAMFAGANLAGASFTNASLVMANLGTKKIDIPSDSLFIPPQINTWGDRSFIGTPLFRGANFSHADLTAAQLDGGYFNETNFSHALLTEADLEDANFSGAVLQTANVTGADLDDVDLTEATLENLIPADADLSDATLCNTTLPDGSLSKPDCEKGQ